MDAFNRVDQNLNSRKILGSTIHATSYQDASDRLINWAKNSYSTYVIAANVHVVMTAYQNPSYQNIVNQAGLVTADGMPLVWALKLLGIKKATRVYGPDLMLAVCDQAAKAAMPIYLYGGTPTMVEKLAINLQQSFPDLIIAGQESPPFRPLNREEEAAARARIQQSGAKIVMVGLGCPKQEEWMARQQGQLAAVMVGVGAAFSFHSGSVSQAPRWMMGLGLEWLYRLSREPGRLWQRYLINNPAFVLLFSKELLQYWWSGKSQ